MWDWSLRAVKDYVRDNNIPAIRITQKTVRFPVSVIRARAAASLSGGPTEVDKEKIASMHAALAEAKEAK